MSPGGSSAGFDSFNEIATVWIELRDSEPLIWRQVEVPTSITLENLHVSLRDWQYEVTVEPEIAERARLAIERMVAIGG